MIRLKNGEVCPDACSYSCGKQQKDNAGSSKDQKRSEYKFIIPNESTAQVVVEPPPVSLIPIQSTPVPVLVTVTSAPKVCEAACMPECTVTCTTLRPALRLLSQLIESKVTTSAECQKTCNETCGKVCLTTGMTPTQCVGSCEPTCEETCAEQCISPCMPACHPECVEAANIYSRLGSARPLPAPAVMLPPERTIARPVKLRPLCVSECEIQCEHQCAAHQLPGRQCESACQRTCFPFIEENIEKKIERINLVAARIPKRYEIKSSLKVKSN
ncbi:hypothetical protein NECAME_12911 [Necator americanus]|uniref:Cysteine rich repeat-containing domain protein n=1 Tax=Necator americanus TaxID=51031 RepID=W2SY34_NECAM|nr:hypothetical protein NECAME_12911 [Necator americanus]ETN74550.1 hypothetical protein NECAME_12911 [Necator americanus]